MVLFQADWFLVETFLRQYMKDIFIYLLFFL